jgi:hypothetical protein
MAAQPPPVPSASTLLPADWAVPATFRRRLGNRAGRQRAMIADGHLLLILNAPPEADSYKRKAAFFWREPKGQWRSTLSVEALRSLQRLVDAYEKAAQELEEKLDRDEDAASLQAVMSRSVPLARAARNLHAALQEARQGIDDPELINLRDHAGEAERIAATGHRLNLLAAIFLPVTALCAIFGMNLAHGLEWLGPILFWGLTVVTLGIGGVLLAWTRRGGKSGS